MNHTTEVMRTEKKYDINYQTAKKLNHILTVSLQRDKFNDGNGYMVRSLYFDTIYNDDYCDKVDGLEHRQKIRLRLYDPKAKRLKLEMKEKIGQLQVKRSLDISKEMALRLMKGEYHCLLTIDSEFAKEMYIIMQQKLYRPKCIIEYRRFAFFVPENDIRVTIDCDIVGTEASIDIFSETLSLYPLTSQTILEVKYNNFLLDYIKDLLVMTGKTEIALSKYCMGRQISYF